ncbi:hypothetical protein HMPREF2842_03965 [Rothia sp. HMSC069C10]|nr:hypothetical protein HMPREF2842_03965 [Rothia sp. HMSC069C10]
MIQVMLGRNIIHFLLKKVKIIPATTHNAPLFLVVMERENQQLHVLFKVKLTVDPASNFLI